MARNYDRFKTAREQFGVQYPTSAYVASFASRDTDSKIIVPDTLLHAVSQKEGSYTSKGITYIGAMIWHHDIGHQMYGAGAMTPRNVKQYIAVREKSFEVDPKHPDCQGYGPVGVTARSLQIDVEELPGGALQPVNHFLVCVSVFEDTIKWLQNVEGKKSKIDPRKPDTWVAKVGECWHSGRGGYQANGVGAYGEDLLARYRIWVERLG